jgi:hypothetical protein
MRDESGNDVDPSAGDGSFEAVMEGKTGVCLLAGAGKAQNSQVCERGGPSSVIRNRPRESPEIVCLMSVHEFRRIMAMKSRWDK